MSGPFQRATGQALPIQGPELPPEGVPDKTAERRKNAFPQPPKIITKIHKLLDSQGAKCNWWWRENEIPLFRTAIGDSFLFRQVFNEASYFYELAARRDEKQKGKAADYPFKLPFNILTFEQAWDIYEKVKGRNLQGLHIAPLGWAEELSRTLSGRQFLLHLDLENFKNGALLSQFEKTLELLREETGIDEPKKSPRANRLVNDGRSFRPIEALDVFRLSEDKVLRRHYSDQIEEARADLKLAPQFS